jgi:tetratricopeptide (TPR) repeat protein
VPENQSGRGGQDRRSSGPGGGRTGGSGQGRGGRPGPASGRGGAGGGRTSGAPGRPGQRSERPRAGAERPDRGADRGAGTFDNSERRGGPRLAPKKPKLPEPRIADGVTGKELDRSVHQQLRTLSKENAEGVAQHLVMVAALLEVDDFDGAEAHAETAVRRAGRVPAAREALGLVAYRKGEWARALSEFRTARRLSGSSHMLALMVDCERGLGRPERALELATSPEAKTLAVEDRVELAIVISGIRRDLGQLDAARLALEIPQLKSSSRKPWTARLAYAYAETLLAVDRVEDAREWFSRAADADDDLETDAGERLAELDGVILTDLLDGEEDDAAATESDEEATR